MSSSGSHAFPLSVGLHELTEHALTDGVWDWEVTYEHGAARTTGELQVFLDEPAGPRLLDVLSIAHGSGGFSGEVEVGQKTDLRVVLEVFTTGGGQIEVEWLFQRR